MSTDPTLPYTPAPDAPARIRYLGDYELLEEIGRGGAGVVYRARQTTLNRDVAVKVLSAGLHASAGEVARFRREAESAARLDHPGIVPVYEVGECEGQQFYSMKLVPGPSLAGGLQGGQRLTPTESARFVQAVAGAIAHAHSRGVLHRDLKPANILIDPDGRPLVADFGLARRLDLATASVPGTVAGTAEYMSPEQALGGELGPASDVYSLGAVLYELLTGVPPHRGSSALDTLRRVTTEEPIAPRRLNGRTPRDLEAVCLKCLSREPAARYASAGELIDDLDRWLAGYSLKHRRVGFLRRARRWVYRRRVSAALSVVVMCLAVAAAVGLVEISRPDRPPIPEAALRASDGPVPPLPAPPDAEQVRAVAELRRVREQTLRLEYEEDIRKAQQAWRADDKLRIKAAIHKYSTPQDGIDPRGWEWHLFDALTRDFFVTLDIGFKPQTMSWSPDGKFLVARGENRVALWQPLAGRQVFLDTETDYLLPAWSPDGQKIAVLGNRLVRKSVLVRDSATGKELVALTEPGNDQFSAELPPRVNSVVWSTDGKYLVTFSTAVHVWDAGTGKLLGAVPGLTQANPACWSADGKHLYVTSEHNNVVLSAVNVATRETAWTRRDKETGWWPVVRSADGRRLAARRSGAPERIVVIDAATGADVCVTATSVGLPESLVLSPDGAGVGALGINAGGLAVWDAGTGREQFRLTDLHPTALGWSRDGKRFLAVRSWRVGNQGSTPLPEPFWPEELLAWDSQTGKPVPPERTDRDAVESPSPLASRHSRELEGVAHRHPDGEKVAFAVGKTVQVWNASAQRGAGPQPPVNSLPAAERPIRSPNGALTLKLQEGALRDARTGSVTHVLGATDRRIDWSAVSPDGRYVASGSASAGISTLRVWNVETGAEVAALTGPRRAVWSPDSKRLVALGFHPADGDQARVWDVAAGRFLHTLNPGTEWPAEADQFLWSPDGGRLLWVAERGEFRRLWNTATGAAVPIDARPAGSCVESNWARTPRHATKWSAYRWSADGNRLLWADCCTWEDQGPRVRAWDAATGKLVFQHDTKAPLFHMPVWSPDGSVLALTNRDNVVELRDGKTGARTHTLKGHALELGAPTWSPDGKQLATVMRAARGCMITVWDVSGEPREVRSLTFAEHRDGRTELLWSPDGKYLAAVFPGCAIRVWDVGTGQQRVAIPSAPHESLLRWAPDSRQVAFADGGTGVALYDVSNGKLSAKLEDAFDLVWTPNSQRMLTRLGGGQMAVRDASGKELIRFGGGRVLEHAALEAADWSRDGNWLAWTRAARTTLHHVPSGRSVPEPFEVRRAVWAADWAPDGRRIVTFGEDGVLQTWNAATGAELNHRVGLYLGEVGLMWAPDERVVATAEGYAQAWEAGTAKASPAFNPRYGNGHALAPGGRHLATIKRFAEAGKGPRVRTDLTVWDTTTGLAVHTRTGRWGDRDQVPVWAPDGTRFAVAGHGPSVLLFDVRTGKEVELPGREWEQSSRLGWSGNGRYLAVGHSVFEKGGPRFEVRVWDAEGKEVATIPGRGQLRELVWGGGRVAVLSDDGALVVTEIATGATLLRVPGSVEVGAAEAVARLGAVGNPHLAPVHLSGPRLPYGARGLAFRPDGSQVILQQPDGAVWVGNVSDRSFRRVFGPPPGPFGPKHTREVPLPVYWSPDGKWAVRAESDRKSGNVGLDVWDAVGERATSHTLAENLRHQLPSWAKWSPDSSRLALLYRGLLVLWSPTGEEPVLIGRPGRPGVSALAWDWNSTRATVAREGGAITVWGTTPDAPVVRMAGDTSTARVLAWSPTGRLASAHDDGTVRLWDAASGKETARFACAAVGRHPIPARLAWAPDGAFLAVAGDDGAIRVRSVPEGREVFVLSGHIGAASVTWSPDGQRIATSDLVSGDFTRTGIRVWNARSGKQLLHIPGEFGAAVWSADGWRLECEKLTWDATPPKKSNK